MTLKEFLLNCTALLLVSGCSVVPPVAANDVSNLAPEMPVTALLDFQVAPGIDARVLLQETRLAVQTGSGAAVPVTWVDLRLWREWGNLYLRVNDYDHDGLNDLAVLKTVGRGQQAQRCYAIYRYNPLTGNFRQRRSFDRCGI